MLFKSELLLVFEWDIVLQRGIHVAQNGTDIFCSPERIYNYRADGINFCNLFFGSRDIGLQVTGSKSFASKDIRVHAPKNWAIRMCSFSSLARPLVQLPWIRSLRLTHSQSYLPTLTPRRPPFAPASRVCQVSPSTSSRGVRNLAFAPRLCRTYSVHGMGDLAAKTDVSGGHTLLGSADLYGGFIVDFKSLPDDIESFTAGLRASLQARCDTLYRRRLLRLRSEQYDIWH